MFGGGVFGACRPCAVSSVSQQRGESGRREGWLTSLLPGLGASAAPLGPGPNLYPGNYNGGGQGGDGEGPLDLEGPLPLPCSQPAAEQASPGGAFSRDAELRRARLSELTALFNPC